jgi:hypothetical protein
VKTVLPAVLASLLVVAAGCGGTDSSGVSTGLARARTSMRCPSAPSLTPRTASATTVVPDTPRLALVCRYLPPPVGRPRRGFSLAGERWATDSARVERLADLLDQLPPIGKVAASCPVFGGRTDLIVFVYSAHRTAAVRITRSGCTPVTNGRVTRYGLGLPILEVAHWPDEGLA